MVILAFSVSRRENFPAVRSSTPSVPASTLPTEMLLPEAFAVLRARVYIYTHMYTVLSQFEDIVGKPSCPVGCLCRLPQTSKYAKAMFSNLSRSIVTTNPVKFVVLIIRASQALCLSLYIFDYSQRG